MSDLAETAVARLRDILSLPVDAEDLKEALGPILRAVELVERRFKRPERLDANVNVRAAIITGAPVDYRTQPAKDVSP